MEGSADSLVHLFDSTEGNPRMEDDKNKSYGSSSILKTSLDSAWYVFDNVSCDQAEDLLRQHGQHGTYLVAHFHDPESYGLSIRLSEGSNVVYKHYAIGMSASEFQTEGVPGTFTNIEDLIMTIGLKINQKLTPIFSKDGHDLSITMNAEPPPDYKHAEKFPQAARRPLPIIVPIHPTLRRMGLAGAAARPRLESGSSDLPEEITGPIEGGPENYSQKGCCWKAFHTDVNGKWWKPHKAGPITAFFLVIGWILFLVLFGWIVGLALILVAVLICFAYIFNFMCTGRCRVEEADEQREATNGTNGNQLPTVTNNASGQTRTGRF